MNIINSITYKIYKYLTNQEVIYTKPCSRLAISINSHPLPSTPSYFHSFLTHSHSFSAIPTNSDFRLGQNNNLNNK